MPRVLCGGRPGGPAVRCRLADLGEPRVAVVDHPDRPGIGWSAGEGHEDEDVEFLVRVPQIGRGVAGRLSHRREVQGQGDRAAVVHARGHRVAEEVLRVADFVAHPRGEQARHVDADRVRLLAQL